MDRDSVPDFPMVKLTEDQFVTGAPAKEVHPSATGLPPRKVAVAPKNEGMYQRALIATLVWT